MFSSVNLQKKLLGAFLLMGALVLAVSLVGWSANYRLSDRTSFLSNNTLPSIIGLWKISEGQNQIQSAELTIINPRTSPDIKTLQFSKIAQVWEQIDEGFREYESTARTAEEDKLYRKFIRQWEKWKQTREDFIKSYQDFEKFGIARPGEYKAQLLRNGKDKSPEMAAAQAASELLDRVNSQAFDIKEPAFLAANTSLRELLALKGEMAASAKQITDKEVSNTGLWVLLGMSIGPVTAVIFGIFSSQALMKPVKKVVNIIAYSSTQINAAIAEQERIASEQAISVNQTTATMEELGASSQQAANAAEGAVAEAIAALKLAEGGRQAVGQTIEGMGTLKEKVSAIAFSIGRLNQQTAQILNISNMVSELASQTNMLSLNAAVEAARAGEQGKGFAIVAVEIRKLADRSKSAAGKIQTLVSDIEMALEATVKVTGEGTATVSQGVELARQTADAFRGVAEAIDSVVENNQQIALTAKQQAIAIQQVSEAMNSINIGAKQTASGLSQTKAGIQHLREAAENLKVLGIG